ncbi:uncharacterized protein [Euphorbia lathyris]|uniref:uncharacterized protein isoform X2 n=1 Tax=Euphorbia lathyris TaxID=212925 RepID=UPI003313DBA5
MAEFPLNLDDGELWLPPDNFRNEYYNASMENNLSTHFAAFSLLQNQHRKPAFHSQLNPPVRGYIPARFGGLDAEFDRRCGIGSSWGRYEPCYEFRIQTPVQNPGNAYRVDNSYLDTRNRVLRRQQNPISNRVNPFQPSGFGYYGGCSGGRVLKESSGTGVFHPRIVNPTTGYCAGGDFKRKQGVKHEMRRVGVNKQEECYYHLPPEMDSILKF